MEDGVYCADENCKDNLESMIELVDQDDCTGSCRQQIAAAGIFGTDFVPLIQHQVRGHFKKNPIEKSHAILKIYPVPRDSAG